MFSYMISSMFRFVLIALMLLQPLQWAWSAVQVTADAAHGLGHQRSHEAFEPVEVLAACALTSGAAHAHACHDNHSHGGNELGLGEHGGFVAGRPAVSQTVCRNSPLFDSACAESIDRPKWVATR